MATNAEVLDLAAGRLGQRKSAIVRAAIVSEVNAQIQELERGTFFPWFLEKTASLSVVANDMFASLPADFLREAEESRPYYALEGKVYYLTKRFYSALLGEEPSDLRYYAVRGETLHFRKPADIAYTINVDYYGKSNDPFADNTDPVSNLWLLNAQNWVLYEALRNVAAMHLHNSQKATEMAALAEKAKRDLYIYHESRINENQDFEVGGASDGS